MLLSKESSGILPSAEVQPLGFPGRSVFRCWDLTLKHGDRLGDGQWWVHRREKVKVFHQGMFSP